VRARLTEQGATIGVDAAEAYRLVVLDQDPGQNAERAESAEVQATLEADEPTVR